MATDESLSASHDHKSPVGLPELLVVMARMWMHQRNRRDLESLQSDNGAMKRTSPGRLPPSAAARARVEALRRGEAPIVLDPAEAQGLAFISPAERQAAIVLATRKRSAEKKRRKR
jgi:hypothetical protein